MESNPCFVNVTCENRVPGFFCPHCPEGFKGVAINGIGLEAARHTKQVRNFHHHNIIVLKEVRYQLTSGQTDFKWTVSLN